MEPVDFRAWMGFPGMAPIYCTHKWLCNCLYSTLQHTHRSAMAFNLRNVSEPSNTEAIEIAIQRSRNWFRDRRLAYYCILVKQKHTTHKQRFETHRLREGQWSTWSCPSTSCATLQQQWIPRFAFWCPSIQSGPRLSIFIFQADVRMLRRDTEQLKINKPNRFLASAKFKRSCVLTSHGNEVNHST